MKSFILEIIDENHNTQVFKCETLPEAIGIIVDYPNCKYVLTEATIHNIFTS